MKKILTLLLLITFITSCTSTPEVEEETATQEVTVENYVVGWKASSYYNVYWNILNNNLNTLTSNISGQITYLSCEAWTKVTKDTIIAKISPDSNSLTYKNNLVQLNSLKSQLTNLKQIRSTTVSDYESKYKQLKLQETELANQLNIVNNNIWDEDWWIANQLSIIEESLVILDNNEASSLKSIDDSITNLGKTAYNSAKNAIKRLDEVFWITDKNKDLNDDFDKFLWTKDSSSKNNLKNKLILVIDEMENTEDNFTNYTSDELSAKLSEYSELLSDAADVIDNSIVSSWSFTSAEISSLYSEFINYSDALVSYKSTLDTAINQRVTTIWTYAWNRKELESTKSELETNVNTLNSNKDTINNNWNNLEEQYVSLENSKSSTLKTMDNNIISVQQAINQLNISFNDDVIYAWINWTVKTKSASINNNVNIWTPICVIVPENNSLKLEIYSPNVLDLWMVFEYYKDEEFIWKGKIISESPVRNSTTQNYTYEWEINFADFKEWDYLDIKVITETVGDEVWVPLKFIFPKLDWYYVNLKTAEWLEVKKIEVGKMNNGEMNVLSWLEYWDTLQQ